MNKYFMTTQEIVDKFDGSGIVIFGCGSWDGMILFKDIHDKVEVTAFIDNYKKDNKFQGVPIIGLDEYDTSMGEIVIASNRFASIIERQIKRQGYKYYIWDDTHIHHKNREIEDYIKFNKKIYSEKTQNRSSQVIVNWLSRHQIYISMLASVSNYWSQKFDAEIVGYIDTKLSYVDIPDVMKEVYDSINASHILEIQLSEEDKRDAEDKYKELLAGIQSWEDVRNLRLFGIDFGTDFLRAFLRWEVPDFSITDETFRIHLHKSVEEAFFWKRYYESHDVQMVIVVDATHRQSLFRDMTIISGVPLYAIGAESFKPTLGYYYGKPYEHFKDFWNQLSPQEQEYGKKWAKKRLQEHISGDLNDVRPENRPGFTFALPQSEKKVLDENDKLKLLICPHIFEEESYQCGEQIFDNNYFSWLCHLGELSEKTPQYDWYLKMHPASKERDYIIIDKILTRYPKITRIPSNTSPIQLRDEGIRYALTVWGSIGHEYPMIGINVIHAGQNPHSQFHFTMNPKTKEEYDNLILHLDSNHFTPNLEELYQFYCIMFLYYKWDYCPFRREFFDNPELGMTVQELWAIGKDNGTWQYREYMNEWTPERHKEIMDGMEALFQKLDVWRPDVFYKRDVVIEDIENGK